MPETCNINYINTFFPKENIIYVCSSSIVANTNWIWLNAWNPTLKKVQGQHIEKWEILEYIKDNITN